MARSERSSGFIRLSKNYDCSNSIEGGNKFITSENIEDITRKVGRILNITMPDMGFASFNKFIKDQQILECYAIKP